MSIPAKTLEQWAKGSRNPVPAQLSDQKRADLAETLEQFAHKLMGVTLEAVKDLNIKDLGITLGIVVDKVLALKAHAKVESQEQAAARAKKDKSVLDLSKLKPHELDMFARCLDKMSPNPRVIYAPRPGDPDYVPVVATCSRTGDNRRVAATTNNSPDDGSTGEV